jgi:hypothetical protein
VVLFRTRVIGFHVWIGRNGGFYSTQSGLNKATDWVNWNLVKREDYRRLYSTAGNWLGLDLAQDTYLNAAVNTPFDLFDP